MTMMSFIKQRFKSFLDMFRAVLRKNQKIVVLNDEDFRKQFYSDNDELLILCKGPSLASVKYPSTSFDVMMPNTLPLTKETRAYYPPKIDYWIKNRSCNLLPLRRLLRVKSIISSLDYSVKYSHNHCLSLWLAQKKVFFLNLDDKTISCSKDKSPEAIEFCNVSLATGIYSIYLAIKYSNYKKIVIYGMDMFQKGMPVYSFTINSLQKNLRYLKDKNIYLGNNLIVNINSQHDESLSLRFLHKCFSQTDKLIRIVTANRNIIFNDLENVSVVYSNDSQ